MKWTMGVLVLMLGTAGVNAGYENVSASTAARVQNRSRGGEASTIVDRSAWKGRLVMEDGKKIQLKNAGGYFLSVELEPKKGCEMWVSGAGLVPGRQVTLYTMNGGLINGAVRDSIAVDEDGYLRFRYTNGTFGAQPIQAVIFGNSATLITVMAKEVKEMDAKEGPANENR